MLRIGAVSYLNTRPLIYQLRERLAGWGELTLNLPSRLADDLSTGRLDVGLIPSIEYFRLRHDGCEIISNAVIACHGPVWSVRLLSRVPIAEIKTLACDEGSRTSVALARILLAEQYQLQPQLLPLPIEQDPEWMPADAALVIGDRAMHPPVSVYHEIWDLGQRWCEWTGLPFVFAMWVARPGIEASARLRDVLEQSRAAGLHHIQPIAQQEAGTHGLTVDEVVRYFTQHLHYELGDREQQGLDAFQLMAQRWNLLNEGVSTPAPRGRSQPKYPS